MTAQNKPRKHTPKPWEAVEQNSSGPMIAHRFETGLQMQPSGLRLIAHMLQRGNSLAEDRANTRLIIAAPELLEALEDCVLDAEKAANPGARMYGYEKAKIAIAKARGAA